QRRPVSGAIDSVCEDSYDATMSTPTITVKKAGNGSLKVLVEIDANRFERLAANLGFFSQDFLRSIEKAEKDYSAGRVRKVRSLKGLRSK
ncbi:MAG: hypothetical protein U1C72_01230, partial [Candidatus Pacearchaeota archaeon]|nr:hypothetical protein [Candidatus Pacearchaeota archaeon]